MEGIEMRFTDMGSDYTMEIEPHKRVLKSAEAAEYVGLHPGELARMRSQSKGPAYIRIDTRVRYRIEDLEVWLFRNRVG